MKVLTVKLSHHEADALASLIDEGLRENHPEDLEDKLFLAVLAKLQKRLQVRTIERRKEYQVQLQPDEALALALFYQRANVDMGTQIGNSLHLLSNQIQQQFI